MIFLSLSLKTKYKIYISIDFSDKFTSIFSLSIKDYVSIERNVCVQKVTTERKNESIHERMRGRVGCMILAVVEHSSLSCTLSLIESIYIYAHTYTKV